MTTQQELIQRIDQMHALLNGVSWYEFLGVHTEESPDEITKAYRRLARDWHIDRFSNVELGDHRRKVEEIFAGLNKAHQTLTNKVSREEYDIEIGLGSEATDIAAILEAESAFRTGKNMLRSASFAGAFEKFKFCVEAQPDEIQYRAHALYCEFALLPKDDEGVVRNKERAQQIFEKLDEYNKQIPEKDWLLVFLGNIALGLGKTNSANSMFNEALMANPSNHEAQRQIRLVRMRKKKADQPKGIFGKLFSKFK